MYFFLFILQEGKKLKKKIYMAENGNSVEKR